MINRQRDVEEMFDTLTPGEVVMVRTRYRGYLYELAEARGFKIVVKRMNGIENEDAVYQVTRLEPERRFI